MLSPTHVLATTPAIWKEPLRTAMIKTILTPQDLASTQ
jgi:hypothetical protein